MSWHIDLDQRTATLRGLTIVFKPDPDGEFDQHSVRDPECLLWRSSVKRGSREIRDERERMHMRTAAVDAYGKALRAAIDPFPNDV